MTDIAISELLTSLGLTGEAATRARGILDTIILLDTGAPTREPVQALFSEQEFPGAHRGDWVRKDSRGNWYALGGEETWLCPALFDYFDPAPLSLWVKVRGIQDGTTSGE